MSLAGCQINPIDIYFPSKIVWKNLIKIQLTKSDPKSTGGGKCPASCQLGLKYMNVLKFSNFFPSFYVCTINIEMNSFQRQYFYFFKNLYFHKNYFQVFHYKVLYALHIILCIICTLYLCHEMAAAWKKERKKYSRKELTPLCYQYINVCTYILHEEFTIYIYV